MGNLGAGNCKPEDVDIQDDLAHMELYKKDPCHGYTLYIPQ